MGRKPKLTSQQIAHAQKLIEQGEPHNTVAESLNVSRRTQRIRVKCSYQSDPFLVGTNTSTVSLT